MSVITYNHDGQMAVCTQTETDIFDLTGKKIESITRVLTEAEFKLGCRWYHQGFCAGVIRANTSIATEFGCIGTEITIRPPAN